MIVRNPTSNTITYSFTTLTLTAGQTDEIDNSFIENTGFQVARDAGLITVVKYEKDMVDNTVVISIGEPLNTPSNSQKGAMVCANNPSATNPFSVRSELEYNDVNIEYVSASVFKTYGTKFTVNNTIVNVPDNLTNNTSSTYTIDENGLVTTSLVEPSSFSHVYINSTPELRCSNILPENMVSTLWRYLGTIWVNENREFPNKLCIDNPKAMLSIDSLEENIEISSLTTLTEINKPFLLKPRQMISITGYITVEADEAGIADFYLGDIRLERKELATAETPYTIHFSYYYQNEGDEYVMINPEFKINGTLTVLRNYIKVYYMKY